MYSSGSLRFDFRGHALQQCHHLLQLLLRLRQLLARGGQFGLQSLLRRGQLDPQILFRLPRSVIHDRVDGVDRVVEAVKSAGNGVSSPDAMSTGETRGDFGDVGVSSSFVCLAPMTSAAQALAQPKKKPAKPVHY